MSFFGDVFQYEKELLGDRWDAIKEHPERAFLGALDQGGTRAWNAVLHKDWKPQTDWWGGPTGYQVSNIESKGINTGPGNTMHNIARTIASMYGLSALGSAAGIGEGAVGGGEAVGGAEGGVGGVGGEPTAANSWQQWARMGANMGGGQSGQTQTQDNSMQRLQLSQRATELRGKISQLEAEKAGEMANALRQS